MQNYNSKTQKSQEEIKLGLGELLEKLFEKVYWRLYIDEIYFQNNNIENFIEEDKKEIKEMIFEIKEEFKRREERRDDLIEKNLKQERLLKKHNIKSEESFGDLFFSVSEMLKESDANIGKKEINKKYFYVKNQLKDLYKKSREPMKAEKKEARNQYYSIDHYIDDIFQNYKDQTVKTKEVLKVLLENIGEGQKCCLKNENLL